MGTEKDKGKTTGKKVVRNKGRDVIGDYYLTNKKIGQQEREARKVIDKEQGTEGKRKPFTKREKIMLVIAIILVATFVIKYAFFSDPSELLAYFKFWQ